jgi:hypothetical protein
MKGDFTAFQKAKLLAKFNWRLGVNYFSRQEGAGNTARQGRNQKKVPQVP